MIKETKRCTERKKFLGRWHICGVRHGATLRTWYCEKHKNKWLTDEQFDVVKGGRG